MTPPRHGRDAGQDGPPEEGTHGAAGAFEAAVGQLADPLNDPLPGEHASPWSRAEDVLGGTAGPDGGPGGAGTPSAQAPHGPQAAQEPPREWYDPEGYERDWYGRQAPVPAAPAAVPPRQDETVALRTPDTRTPDTRRIVPPARTAHRPQPERDPAAEGATEVMAALPAMAAVPAVATVESVEEEPRTTDEAGGGIGVGPQTGAAGAAPGTGGRAERRRAAKGRGRRRPDPQPGPASGQAAAAKPMSRVEARRAARAAKDSPAVVVSRVVGELFISLGVLMLLFVTYQLWWTNVRADQIAGNETHKIQDDWASGKRAPGVFEAGQGFAIIHIPKLDVVTPIAEGTSKDKVLDRGMVGHYSEKPLRTAMPSAKQGNFALAGHRNTHGEPFRYINRLRPGDPIVVETQDAYYTYEMTSVLPQTSPSNVSVIGPVPPQSGFTEPGRYITLTTCTPEFTSTYRLIVWGKMVDERPRSKGKPDALVG
ncbi:class E sortase [Streptomyces sp. NBC_01260]|uniref:class E sortase n=1 Tax=unclassified Streptomyces TaxID=2593676 RepID=UPI000F559337|nr:MULTISPECIES: class E sortase [unclassified Streptomyces]RPK47750.1 Sortase family protein [Streptomyces sp. ADI92-24]